MNRNTAPAKMNAPALTYRTFTFIERSLKSVCRRTLCRLQGRSRNAASLAAIYAGHGWPGRRSPRTRQKPHLLQSSANCSSPELLVGRWRDAGPVVAATRVVRRGLPGYLVGRADGAPRVGDATAAERLTVRRLARARRAPVVSERHDFFGRCRGCSPSAAQSALGCRNSVTRETCSASCTCGQAVRNRRA
jgi:hypothetical protein